MGALRTDQIGTPIRTAEVMIDRLESLAKADQLSPEQHLAILQRLGLLETEFKHMAAFEPSSWPSEAVADLGVFVAAQAVLVKFGGLDRATFERGVLRMRHAIHQLRLWSAGVRAFPHLQTAPQGRQVGRFTVYEGGRS